MLNTRAQFPCVCHTRTHTVCVCNTVLLQFFHFIFFFFLFYFSFRSFGLFFYKYCENLLLLSSIARATDFRFSVCCCVCFVLHWNFSTATTRECVGWTTESKMIEEKIGRARDTQASTKHTEQHRSSVFTCISTFRAREEHMYTHIARRVLCSVKENCVVQMNRDRKRRKSICSLIYFSTVSFYRWHISFVYHLQCGKESARNFYWMFWSVQRNSYQPIRFTWRSAVTIMSTTKKMIFVFINRWIYFFFFFWIFVSLHLTLWFWFWFIHRKNIRPTQHLPLQIGQCPFFVDRFLPFFGFDLDQYLKKFRTKYSIPFL